LGTVDRLGKRAGEGDGEASGTQERIDSMKKVIIILQRSHPGRNSMMNCALNARYLMPDNAVEHGTG